MLLGAIEISSRSLRFCVGDVGSADSTRLLERDHAISARQENLDRLTALIMAEVEAARDRGAERVEVTACPDLRGTRLARQLDRACTSIGTGGLKIPTARRRAEVAFLGVTVPDAANLAEPTAVALVGERTVSLAVGSPGFLPDWVASRPVGSVSMTKKARFSDPPRPVQLEAAIAGSTRKLGELMPPVFDRLLVASAFAPVVERLCGSRFDADGARAGIDATLGLTSTDLAAWFAIAPGRSRCLPAVLVAHLALAEVLAHRVEPVVFEPLAGRDWLARRRTCAGAGRV